ncbi:TonB family protein [Microbulbifer sp. SH-1]|uniref:energy transducer TonB n=1 Tax=Microbulbifer sp. SH-1 TaxID=2681547 RepID=UPI0014091191|nr:energy transducer TonB [Microbulbifer sp. SH-1]QIL89912.1 TonB family protein [Microbulbifer sp. SH-1]
MKIKHFALALPLLAAAISVDAMPRLNGVKQQNVSQKYETDLTRHTLKNISYPRRAQEKGWEGEVLLKISINKKGEVQEIQVVKESNYSSLNREALRSVERANPYPAIPDELGTDTYFFTVPINFKMSG